MSDGLISDSIPALTYNRMRALCDRGPAQAVSNSPTPAATPKYKLAEHRYGREEMLALFEHNTKPPDELRRENASLVKEACQLPLSLISMTEEETALWATSVNSEAVLRISNKDRGSAGRAPPNLSDRLPDNRTAVRSDVRAPPLTGGRVIGAAPGMRGVPIRPPPPISSARSFGYGRSFEEEPESDRREGFRSDVFKRGTSVNEDQRNDRFRADADEAKPRNRLDSRSNAENWRSAGRSTNEGPNWRSSARREETGNWKGGTSSSWRDDGADDQGDNRNGRNRYRSNDWEHHHQNDDGSNLPEWSLDDGGPSVGTFDASGAFRSGSPGRELEDDGEGEWTSVRSNRAKRDRDLQKDHHLPERQQQPLPAHPEDQKNLHRDSTDNFESSHQSQSLLSKNLFPDRLDHDSRANDHSASRSGKNGTSSASNDAAGAHSRDFDEDFCSIEKLTESMVMKWTEEEDAKSSYSQTEQHQQQRQALQTKATHPGDTDGSRWFYRDPQGEIQGPFSSSEMMEWYSAGYFEMNLLVRRSGSERFSQLGYLIESCGGQVPFAPGSELPPVRQDPPKSVHSSGQPHAPAAGQSVSHPSNDLQIRQMLLFQQIQQQQQAAAAAQQQRQRQQQQLQQQQLAHQQQQQMQTQLRQLLEHLKRQEGFTELSQLEQQQVLLRQYTQHVEQTRRSQQLISAETAASQPQQAGLAGRAAPPAAAHMGAGRFPAPANAAPSIWELSNGGVMTSAALEEIQRREQEEQERKEEQKRKLMEEEQRRRHEAEIGRKAEEEQRRMLEQQRKRDEERKKEERAKQEEEMRRHQEEERITEERRREEQRRRHDEMRKLDEMARKQKEEAERCRQKEEEEKIRQMQKQQQEIEKQRHEHEARVRLQHQQQQQAEAMKRFQEKRGWGEVTQAGQLSLSEIQKLQEEKEFEERLEEMKQKASMRQTFYPNSNHKPGMTWVQSSAPPAAGQVKTLSEIQREEAEKLAKVRKELEERERDKPQAAGIWSNAASQLSWKASGGSAWGTQSPTSSKPSNLTGAGFWESDPPAAASNNHKHASAKDKQQPASGQQVKQTSAKSRKAEVTSRR